MKFFEGVQREYISVVGNCSARCVFVATILTIELKNYSCHFLQNGTKKTRNSFFLKAFDIIFKSEIMKEKRDKVIRARVTSSELERIKKISDEKGIYVTDLILSSIDNKLLNSDRIEIMKFIEKQGNIFAKIENNINQIARIVNTEKNIHPQLLSYYNEQLKELVLLKDEQNKMFKKIYGFLAR